MQVFFGFHRLGGDGIYISNIEIQRALVADGGDEGGAGLGLCGDEEVEVGKCGCKALWVGMYGLSFYVVCGG